MKLGGVSSQNVSIMSVSGDAKVVARVVNTCTVQSSHI